MTNPETLLEAGKQIAAIASGRARRDEPVEADAEELLTDASSKRQGKLTALPNEATVECANDANDIRDDGLDDQPPPQGSGKSV